MKKSPQRLPSTALNPRDATLERMVSDAALAACRAPAPGPVVIAVSGGPDSMALLHFMVSRSRGPLECVPPGHRAVVAAHVNHGLRGDASDQDAAFVREQAKAWDVEAIVAMADIPATARARAAAGASEEATLRRARYTALREIAREVGASQVLTAHTADDQVETVLFRLLRGSGLRGLGGMRPVGRVHGIRLVRPLLDVTRAQVMDYLERHAIPYRRDATNDGTVAARNYLRHEIVPRLESRLNPAVAKALMRAAEIFRETDAYLEGRARRVYRNLSYEHSASKISLDGEKLLLYPKLLQTYVFRRAVRELTGNLRDLSSVHLRALHGLAASHSGQQTHLPGHVSVRREQGRIVLSLEPRTRRAPSKP